MDPSAIKPPGRIAVSRFDPRQRAGRIVTPVDGAITSRAPAPHLVHDDPQRPGRDAQQDTQNPAAEAALPAAIAEASQAYAYIPPVVPTHHATSTDALLIAALDVQPSSIQLDAYRPAPCDPQVQPNTDIEV